MKKINVGYMAMWYGGLLVIVAVLAALGILLDLPALIIAGFFSFAVLMAVLPGMIRRTMEKCALKLEKQFAERGFSYQHKFVSNSGVFYIDSDGGRLGIVWKYNPSVFCLADLSKLTEIRTNDGKQINGTSLVSCQFKLDGKRIKIHTLRVSNGQLSMKSAEVSEAISKADQLCELLRTAQQAAGKKAAQ